jgi:hypothetical protein
VGVRIDFHKGPSTRYRSTLHRRDGVVVAQNAALVGGRRSPHALERGAKVADAAQEALRQAEVIVRAVADASLEHRIEDVPCLRRATGERWWHPPITSEALARIDIGLRSTAEAWEALPPGESLSRIWGRRSAHPVGSGS